MVLLSGFLIAAFTVVGAHAPQQPAAPAGKEVCAGCHDTLAAQFDRSVHSELVLKEAGARTPGCEACHGNGAKHVEAGGGVDTIRSFTSVPENEAARACLACHRDGHAMNWAGSDHAMNGVSCLDCHKIHQSRQVMGALTGVEGMAVSHATAPAVKGLLAKPETELCLSCHQAVRVKLMSQSRHPIREGRMACSSCHDVHGNGLTGLKTTERANDLCTSCHARYQGPFVFEHAPVEEDCMTCHDPHGTVANNLLKQNEPFICLQCHEMHFHAARMGQTTPWYLPTAGSDNKLGVTGFMQSYNTRCTNCHRKVHGSDLPSQGVSGHGKALIR